MARVLVVDDEPNIVLSLEFLMEQAGFEVTTAEDGETALRFIADDAPDLVLLDISLPGIGGFEVLERLRGDSAHRHLPIIMLTAHGREVEREKGLALGADDYITKPFSTRTLVDKVRALLDKDADGLARIRSTPPPAPGRPVVVAQRRRPARRCTLRRLAGQSLPAHGMARLALWLGCFSGGATLLASGFVLERRLFTPLRHLQGQLARLAAHPDAPEVSPPTGWLRDLGADLARIHSAWQEDRRRLDDARTEGARDATRVSQRLEALLQTLDTPLLLCDRHHRLLLYNQAAERLFAGHPGLGLGKALGDLLPTKGLAEIMATLSEHGGCREVLIPHDEHWLHVDLRRLTGDETLLTLTDATTTWAREFGPQADVDRLLPALRRHGAGLISAADALAHLARDDSPELRRRLETVIDEEGDALAPAWNAWVKPMTPCVARASVWCRSGPTTSGRPWTNG